MWVAPFVFTLSSPPTTAPNHEVAEILQIPLEQLLAPGLQTSLTVDHRGASYEFPAWDVHGRKVWGLTYAIISGLLPLFEEALGATLPGSHATAISEIPGPPLPLDPSQH
jgi:hypothetical protein